MWRHIVPPVIVVITLWVLMSGATTFYVQWIELSYQRVFAENVSSIRAADALERIVWGISAAWPLDETEVNALQSVWSPAKRDLDRELDILRNTICTPKERNYIATLEPKLSELRDHIESYLRSSGLTGADAGRAARIRTQKLSREIAVTTEQLRDLNQSLIEEAAAQRGAIRQSVFLSRLLLLIVGPLLGLWLGWRLAGQLHRSVMRIAVTLHDDELRLQHEIGSVAVTPVTGLDSVQKQAEQVIERLRRVNAELQSARREVVRAERLAAVGELAAGVAHELRNPLTSVKLLLQHASRQPEASSLGEGKWKLMLEEIGRMEVTIQALLDFSRPRALRTVRHDVRETLQRALNLVDGRARQYAIEIDSHLGEWLLEIDGDSERLHQVFVNLLLNAIESMPEGGRLKVEAAPTEEQRVQVRVHDTGPGIADDMLTRLFEPFATNKERGTGLGLAISRRIIEEHGGRIYAANHPAGGAVFIVELCSAVEHSALAEVSMV